MIDSDWSPDKVEGLRNKWESLRLQITPDMTSDNIMKMQLEVVQFASELTWPLNQSRLYEKRSQAEGKRAYTTAYLSRPSEESDRRRDTNAKADVKVRIAEAKSDEAEVYRKLLEDFKEDAVRLHYALRAMMKDQAEERRFI